MTVLPFTTILVPFLNPCMHMSHFSAPSTHHVIMHWLWHELSGSQPTHEYLLQYHIQNTDIYKYNCYCPWDNRCIIMCLCSPVAMFSLSILKNDFLQFHIIFINFLSHAFCLRNKCFVLRSSIYMEINIMLTKIKVIRLHISTKQA